VKAKIADLEETRPKYHGNSKRSWETIRTIGLWEAIGSRNPGAY